MRRWIVLLLVLTLLSGMALAKEWELPVTSGDTVCDLTGFKQVKDTDAASLAEALNSFPSLTRCVLTGVSVKNEVMDILLEACPGIDFLWDVPLGKEFIPSDTKYLDLDRYKKVNYARVRKALQYLPDLTRVTMFDYRFSASQMDDLKAEFPGVDFEWTLTFDKYLIRTDSTAFSTLKGRQEPRYTSAKIMQALKYLPDLKALDLGHNNITDLEFLNNWPGLKILIVIDSKQGLTDISPLKEQKDLEYVELFMQKITDISPLADHTALLDLNLCYNDITDLTPLYSCTNLERLWISNNPHLSGEEIDKLKVALPNLKINDYTKQSTGYGWREHPRYFVMYDIFQTRVWRPFDDEAPAAGP